MNMNTLVGTRPKEILLHGPTKRLVNNFHWHSPNVGIVASYTILGRDVKDHFDIFRGVDQVEAFAQATIVACGTFLECRKQECQPIDLRDRFVPAFISIGQVNFHNYLEKGDTFISIGQIKFFKFRQMTCDGRIYKAPKGLDLDAYFSNFNEERLAAFDLDNGFVKVAELFDITGRALKKEMFNKLNK